MPKGKAHKRCAGWKLTSNKWVFFRDVPNWNVVNCRPQTSRNITCDSTTLTRIGCTSMYVGNGTGRQSETLISRWAEEEIVEKLLVETSLSPSLFYSVCFCFFKLKFFSARSCIPLTRQELSYLPLNQFSISPRATFVGSHCIISRQQQSWVSIAVTTW